MLRTFLSTFDANLRLQIRAYTLTGWTLTSILSPIVLLAGAWVVVRLLAGGAPPSRFVALTGYEDYLAFVVLGVAFHGLATSALEDGGNAIYEEEANGTWDLLELAPFNRFAWMSGKILAGLVTAFVDFAAVLAVGVFAFERVPTVSGVAVALLGVLLTVAALQGLAFLMAAVGLVWKQPFALAFLLTPPLLLLTGMMFPVEVLPAWLQTASAAIPLTHGLVIVRDAILLDRGLLELAPVFGRLAATGIALGIVGFSAFLVMERRARRSGVLGRY